MGTVTIEIFPDFGGVFYVQVDASEVSIFRENYAPEVDDALVEEWIDDHLKNVDSWDISEYPQV